MKNYAGKTAPDEAAVKIRKDANVKVVWGWDFLAGLKKVKTARTKFYGEELGKHRFGT